MRFKCLISRRIGDKDYEAGKTYDLPKAVGEKYIRVGRYFERVASSTTAEKSPAKKAPARRSK